MITSAEFPLFDAYRCQSLITMADLLGIAITRTSVLAELRRRRSFGVIWIRISDPKSLGSFDSHRFEWSWITPKERTLIFVTRKPYPCRWRHHFPFYIPDYSHTHTSQAYWYMIDYIWTRDHYIHQYLMSKWKKYTVQLIKSKIYFFSLKSLESAQNWVLHQNHCANLYNSPIWIFR